MAKSKKSDAPGAKTPAARPGNRRTLRKLKRVLVANRGEIALRVIRTLRRLGIESVAVHSEIDRTSPHVRWADAAAEIGPAPSGQSYLNVEAILGAARAHGADAIHPGYGFLSENAAFADAVEAAGLTYLGPTSTNIERLGDKLGARSALRDAGIPPVPGSGGAVNRSDLGRLARDVGFPLLLKAAAGGGGKGIRIVRDRGELEAAFDTAASEAQASFGSSALLAERYVERARHVEVQVLGDGRGGVRLFHERDCSTQRRLQKVFEETPSPAVTPALREKLLLTAGRAVSSEKYRGAGTLEFLLSENGELFFLEMNTRIQVEHPVTEITTGADLVAEQVAIAEGAAFPAFADRIEDVVWEPRGVAVELRVNAEDPAQDFQPATGKVHVVRWPQGPHLRVDTAVEAGTEVTPYYDSLLAKIIAWGATRTEALGRLEAGLRETRIGGLATTLPLGLALLRDRDFLEARNHCQYLAEKMRDPKFYPGVPSPARLRLQAAAAVWLAEQNGQPTRPSRVGGPPADNGQKDDLSPWAQLQRFSLKEGR